ncbi:MULTISPECIES: hypothetical protein [Streptomyces]|uniref:Secreted protein n=1 Tax=Streptomyces fuscus TaxID=3048495 RepID=A0ABT7J3D1_9ACTN|nr:MULTISPECIES: hypothetical protein [Streptomyces]MCM1973363.1 hypothetical protein [Streptomyces sp. G1]MDL2079373.1 hypothetical protein [Streptomyces fuscus]
MRTKISAVLTTVALTVGVGFFAAPSASAAAGCPRSGYPTPGDPGLSCTSLSNGALFHTKYHPDANKTRIKSYYIKTGGGAITAKLGYSYNGTSHYSGSFTQKAGTTKSRTWDRNDYNFWCRTTIGLLKVGGDSYQTPISHCN